MKKELEALEKIGNLHSITKGCAISYTDEYKVIEQALIELQTIKEPKPNEALECLEGINNYLSNVYDYKEIKEEIQKDINTIKQALLKAQENEKVLEIIFKKKVNTLLLELAENVDEYNERIVPNGKLTKVEFNLLKRCFDND